MGRRRNGRRQRRPDDLTMAQIEAIASDETRAVAAFERLRFPSGLICPVCAATEADGKPFWRIATRKALVKCGSCRRQFSLTAGTPAHRSRLPLGAWLRAIWLMVSSSKGVSALKISEALGTTYRTAWHLCHRIRAWMRAEDIVLSGVVEADETYAGAPPRQIHGGGATGAPTGRGTRRPIVLTLAERGGAVVMRRVRSHSTAALKPSIDAFVDPGAVMMTDALPAYRRASGGRAHHAVNHSAKEFVIHHAGGVGVHAHANTAEAIHSLLDRAVRGVYHRVSPKHLDRYLDELTFRLNARGHGHLGAMARLLSAPRRPLPVKALFVADGFA